MAQDSPIDPKNLSVEEILRLTSDYHELLNEAFPIASTNERIFARTMKLMEELGELANEILSKFGLQRQSKVSSFDQENLENEFGDVLLTVLLLGAELEIDMVEVMKRKFAESFERMEAEMALQDE